MASKYPMSPQELAADVLGVTVEEIEWTAEGRGTPTYKEVAAIYRFLKSLGDEAPRHEDSKRYAIDAVTAKKYRAFRKEQEKEEAAA